MSSELIKHVSDASFDADVLKSALPVLVDCWAEWCRPCKLIDPILDEIARDYQGRIQVVKLNVDENTQISARYNIRELPKLLIFENGDLTSIIIRRFSKDAILLHLEKFI
ncbi:thioredoxin [Pseudomonas sp. TH43]|uniref:thioredoxin n=1 Tax=Pseudomonas sp. TH43 TaxID=2796407 RepID=UPI001912EEC6|nr:thioredoxin [Pseudomonas sp. TH43]MBK5377214.1 thioredoxin [Pseudomonas sp. TH43]